MRSRHYKREAATGIVLGLIIIAGAKYFAAALLVLWLLAGGQ
jgi:hypothetical protein